MPADFPYTALSQEKCEIRLINLLPLFPGHAHIPIRCTSCVVSLDTWPMYETLSYAWGNPDITATIEMDDHPFHVTINLLSALRRLRLSTKPRTLWVDALCINQKNEAEKSWQVNLMGLIYTKCHKGLLWLGEESEEGDSWCLSKDKNCFELLGKRRSDGNEDPGSWRSYNYEATVACPKIHDQDQVQTPHHECRWHGRRPRIPQLLRLVDSLEENEHLNLVSTLADAAAGFDISSFENMEQIYALAAFLDRSWWSRIWTVQEAVLPPDSTIICGGFECSFDAMVRAAENLRNHSMTCCSLFFTQLSKRLEHASFGKPTINILTDFHNRFHELGETRDRIATFARSYSWAFNDAEEEKEKHTLLHYWYTFNNREAKDPRDKVYALLGLLPPMSGITANYEIDMARLNKNLSALLLTDYPDKSLSVLWKQSAPTGPAPSWVKDFGERSEEAIRRVESSRYDAANGNFIQAKRCSDEIVSIVGIQVDTVSEVGPASHVTHALFMNCGSSMKKFARFINIRNRSQDPYCRGGTIIDAFTRMLTGEQHVLSSSHPGFSQEDMNKFVQSLLAVNDEDAWINVAIANAFVTVAHKRRLFFTRKGLFGLGPEWMKPGDEAWVLFGSTVPFILRPVQYAKRKSWCKHFNRHFKDYFIIGDCYLQGVMFGEAARNTNKKRLVFLK